MRNLLAVMTLGFSMAAFAGSFHNDDSKTYNLYITVPGSSVTTSINSNTTQMSTCGGFPCTIENKDNGEKVSLTSDKQSLEIKGGKFIVK